jgi:hypothetical protein
VRFPGAFTLYFRLFSKEIASSQKTLLAMTPMGELVSLQTLKTSEVSMVCAFREPSPGTFVSTSLSRSQYARGGLPDRAINTLKADHRLRRAPRREPFDFAQGRLGTKAQSSRPCLARWIVIQR